MICVLPYLLTTHTEAIGRFQPGGQEGAQCVLIAGHSPGMRRQSTIACVIGILLSEGRAGGEGALRGLARARTAVHSTSLAALRAARCAPLPPRGRSAQLSTPIYLAAPGLASAGPMIHGQIGRAHV